MRKALWLASCSLLILFSPCSIATENIYGVISGGFADSEFSASSVDGASYKFAIGHQFHPQWYVEAGYQRIADEGGDANSLAYTEILEGDALSISVLGKAGSRQGELFYRLGLMRADMMGYTASADCSADCVEFDSYDDAVFAGVVGIGYDWYIGLNSMIRFEVEHIAGEDSLQVNAAYIGFRYNFN